MENKGEKRIDADQRAEDNTISLFDDEKAKIDKLETEKQEVLNRAVSGRIENIRDRVAFILNNSNEARNSDIELAWLYWANFEAEKLVGATVTKEQMMQLARIPSLTRIRAKIQNEYKLFQANDKVKRFRGTLEEDNRVDAIEDKPTGIGTYSVYIDETGKTQDFLSVGSLWQLEFNVMDSLTAFLKINKWKEEKQINFEFHFAELSNSKIGLFKDFFIKFLTLCPGVGFKLIVVNNKGLKDKTKAITDLSFHLLHKGIMHENETGRAPLPRVLQVWLDEEEKGSDQLKIENLKERLRSQKIDGLHLGNFEAVSSAGNYHVQMVDLFTGSINRKLHFSGGTYFKDEFADFVLETLKFDIGQINTQNDQVDNSALFNLADFNP